MIRVQADAHAGGAGRLAAVQQLRAGFSQDLGEEGVSPIADVADQKAGDKPILAMRLREVSVSNDACSTRRRRLRASARVALIASW